jgi:hypothetical protein
MARGKEAAQAANRQLESAREHIRWLTGELADAKVRAKEAEARAARLEGIERMLPAASAKNDEMLAKALTALQAWKKFRVDQHERSRKALQEVCRKLLPDLDLPGYSFSGVDNVEFMKERYPHILEALLGGPVDGDERVMTGDSPFRPLEEKLSLDDLRRFQRLMGERAVFDADQGADASKVWTDLLDARGVGFSKEEMLEYALGVEAESPG